MSVHLSMIRWSMKRVFRIIRTVAAPPVGLALLLALVSPAVTAAEPPSSPAAIEVPAEAPVAITPHRATYTVAMASARNSSKVADVRGRMSFSWNNSCDGWIIEQRFQLRFSHTEGDDLNMVTTYATWESHDSRAYRFNVRKWINGTVDEEIKGEAHHKAGAPQARVHYAKPESQSEDLPVGTLFPTAHTQELLLRASQGEKLLSRTVFDGSDTEGALEINAVIGSPITLTAPAGVSSPLFLKSGWPIRLAFFPLGDEETSTPDYEMTLVLMRNGVAESLLIDYGDFVIKATLETLEALHPDRC